MTFKCVSSTVMYFIYRVISLYTGRKKYNKFICGLYHVMQSLFRVNSPYIAVIISDIVSF